MGEEVTEYREGFTPRVVLITAIAGLVLYPVMLWGHIAGVGAFGIAAAFMTMVLFGELTRIFGSPLTAAELATIRWSESMSVMFFAASSFVFASWFRRHEIAKAFGVADLLPEWYAPPPTSPAVLTRNLYHRDFWFAENAPFGMGPGLKWLIEIGPTLLGVVALAIIIRQLFIVEEKLPWPTGAIAGELAVAMSKERDPSRFRYFAVAAVASMIYTIVQLATVGLIGFFDLTPTLGRRLPGCIFTMTPVLYDFALGLVLSPQFILGWAIGTLATQFILNPILVSKGIIRWIPGINWSLAYQYSSLDFWITAGIAIAFAVAIPPLLRARALLPKAIKSLSKISRVEGMGLFSPKVLIAMILASYTFSVIWAKIFAPDYPMWIAALSAFLQVIFTVVSGYTVGLIVVPVYPPYITRLLNLTFYDGIKGWIVAPEAAPSIAVDLGIGFKAAEIAKANPMSIIKAHVFGYLYASLLGFIFVQFFWKTFDIPSRVLPAPMWLFSVIDYSVWWTRRVEILFRWHILVPFFIVGLVLAFLPNMYALGLGIALGLGGLPTVVIMYLLGVVARKMLIRRYGKEWYDKYHMSIAAGIFAGTATIQVLYLVMQFLPSILWPLPY